MCEKAFKDIGYIPPQRHFWNAVIIKPPPYKVPYTIVYDKTIESIQSGCDPGRKLTGQLYRQDQLQEILGFEIYEFLDICSESDGIMWQALHDYATSMEQLWLAFVMKEKYEKVWDQIKKDWVRE